MAEPGLVVAIDSSIGAASCAVRFGERSASMRIGGARSVESLERVVRATLAAVGGVGEPVARVVVGAGPGSFIGVRSAVTFANALAYAHGCEVAAVRTLDAVGSPVTRPGDRTLVVLPAGRGRLYAAGYERSSALSDVLTARSLDESELVALVAELGGPLDLYGAGAVPHADALAADGVRVADAIALEPTATGVLHVAERDPERVEVVEPGAARPRYEP